MTHYLVSPITTCPERPVFYETIENQFYACLDTLLHVDSKCLDKASAINTQFKKTIMPSFDNR